MMTAEGEGKRSWLDSIRFDSFRPYISPLLAGRFTELICRQQELAAGTE